MEILKPIPQADMPKPLSERSDYTSIYQQALELDGLALPIAFDTTREAANFASVISQHNGRGQKLGLRATRRGNTVFLYRK